MGVAFAPPITTAPISSPFVAPAAPTGVNAIVPFVRGRLPSVSPPPILVKPPLPTLPPLTTTPALPFAPTIARTGGIGLAIVGAGVLGLGIGNAIYEDLLGRPFGPSLGDYLFPEGQPLPTPIGLPVPVGEPLGQCEARYLVTTTVEYRYIAPFAGLDPVTRTISKFFDGPVSRVFRADSGNRGVFKITYAYGTDIFDQVFNDYLPSYGTSNVSVVREDGLPDDCGVFEPSPLPDPIGIPQPVRPQPNEVRPIPHPLPEPIRPQIPRIEPTPTIPFEPGRIGAPIQPDIPGFPDIPIPLHVPDPATKPNFTPLPVPDPLPKLKPVTPATKPKTPPLDCCPSLERKLDELLEREEPEECDLTELKELLEKIKEKLCIELSGTVDLTPCDSEESVSENYEGEGIEGIHESLLAITKSLNLINENTRCEGEGCTASVPDWWQVRKGAETPQLSIVLRKEGTKNYHSLNIPHPIVQPKPTTCPIKAYVAGNWQATIYLSDNSKFIVNAKLKGDAIRVATQAASLIMPEFLSNPLAIATTERRGFAVNQSLMIPRYMDYHPEGQKGRRPLWRVLLD